METEKKKKSKTPIIVIIIILLAVAGFCYYKFIYQPDQLAQYELPDTEVETELVAETDWYDNEIDDYRGAFNAMAENESSYYIIESLSIRDEDNWKPRFNVYQTNKAEFDEKNPMSTEKAIKKVNDGVLGFLNFSYDALPMPLYQTSTADGKIFGNLDVSSRVEEVMEPLFGGSVVDYFESHELVLSCDSCKVNQVGIEIDSYGYIYYYFNITADVKTESCIGDMSDLGFFANEGESKTVNIRFLGSYEDNTKDIWADFMLIE